MFCFVLFFLIRTKYIWSLIIQLVEMQVSFLKLIKQDYLIKCVRHMHFSFMFSYTLIALYSS